MAGTQPDVGWAWMVLFASFGAHVVNGCFLYCVGIVHAALLERYQESVTFTSWTTALAVCFMASAGPLASFSINRFNCRITTIVGGLMVTFGCLISAFTPSLGWIMLSFSVLTGIGSGVTHSAAVVAVGFAFEKNRNFASGAAAAGAGLGILFLAPAITAAKHTYGYEGLFIIMAGIGFHHILFGALFRPSKLEIHGKYLQRRHKRDESGSCSIVVAHFKILANKSLLCLCISILCWTLGVFLIFLHFPVYSMSKNYSPMQVSFLLSLAGACGCFSRVVTGLASNSESVNELVIYFGSYGILGIASLLLPLYGASYTGQLVFAAILGLYSGNSYGILCSINITFVGIKNLATAYGVEMFFHGLGSLIGPPIAGSSILLGAVLGMTSICFKRHEEDKTAGLFGKDVELQVKPPHDYEDDTGKAVETNSQRMYLLKKSSDKAIDIPLRVQTDVCAAHDLDSDANLSLLDNNI